MKKAFSGPCLFRIGAGWRRRSHLVNPDAVARAAQLRRRAAVLRRAAHRNRGKTRQNA